MKTVLALLLLLMFSMPAPSKADEDCDERFLERERLAAFIKTKKIQSISQIISHLPACYLANSVKIYKSSSLQCATPKAPRVVIWLNEPRGRTRCSFNSGKKEDYKEFYEKFPGIDCRENMLECEHFTDDDQAKFEFYEIKASADDTGKPLSSHPSRASSLAQVSPVNPPQCMTACHRGNSVPGTITDPRPNMEKYPLWVGFYGGVHDDLFKGDARSADLKEFTHFKDQYFPYKKTNPRYRELIEIVDEELKGKEPKYEASGKPVTDLHNTLEYQNYRRIARKFYEKSTFDRIRPFRYAILAALSCNDDVEIFKDKPYLTRSFDGPTQDLTTRFPIESFVPESVRASFAFSFNQIASKALIQHQNNIQHQLDLQRPLGNISDERVEKEYELDTKNDPTKSYTSWRIFSAPEFSDMTRLAFLAENLGISSHDWAMTHRHTLSFGAGRHNPHQIIDFLLPKLLDSEEDKDLKNLATKWGTLNVDACKRLKQKSIEALTEAQKAEKILLKSQSAGIESTTKIKTSAETNGCVEFPKPPPLLNQCINCHVKSDEEFFPFDNPKMLISRLRLGTSSRNSTPLIDEIEKQIRSGRMPYNMAITNQEREGLLSYFAQLRAINCPKDQTTAHQLNQPTHNNNSH